jgi:hypothetical protein
MTLKFSGLAAVAAVLISAFSSGTMYASTFGVFGFPVDMSANTKETLLPSGTVVFQHSSPLFNTVEGESVEILDPSLVGVNASGRSTNIRDAFASSLAAGNGDGGVGVSQLIFGPPAGSGSDSLRQLFAQSLWTQTFTYTGTFPIDLTLHLHVPSIQVGLLGVPPRRTGISATETAEATGSLVRAITHPDLTIQGGHIEFGLREFEQQLPSGSDILNIGTVRVIDNTGQVITQAPRFNGDDFNPSFSLDSFSFDVDLGELHTGDILSYTYTLTAEGTTHGFEHGYFAFLGDPFGGEPISDNLSVTITPADVPEASTCWLMLSGFAGLLASRRIRKFPNSSRQHEPDIMNGSVLCPAHRSRSPIWSVFTRNCAN